MSECGARFRRPAKSRRLGAPERPADAEHVVNEVASETLAHRMDQHVERIAFDFVAPSIETFFQL
jgi:hypothetical protein